MTQGKTVSDFEVVRAFFARRWRGALSGIVIGTATGFCLPTLLQIIKRVGLALSPYTDHFFKIAIWPRHGMTTLVVLAILLVTFCGVSLARFLIRVWASWRAGLVSGLTVVWFLACLVAFSLFSLTDTTLPLLILAVGIAVTIAETYRTCQAEKQVTEAESDSDEPIWNENEDIIGRSNVVGSLVRAIISDRTPVVALTGNYGDGKSSVLNLLFNALSRRDDIVCVRFSTWLPMDQTTLISTLLSTVLAELETKLFVPKIKRDLTSITRLLFSVLPKVPSSVLDLIKKPSQDQQIGELRRNLSKLPIRVVVLLDDLDRMRRTELDALLKLLRGVPEFPQFTYVCAFAPDALVQILQRNDSEKDRERAQYFLEKFFPDEIPLPKIESSCLAEEFEKRFYAICDQSSCFTSADDRQKFQNDFRFFWQMHLKGYFTNLRRVKLLTTRLNRSLPLISHEVNLRDFVLLESVRMINPVLYEEIFRNARYFMFSRWRFTAWPEVVHPDEEEEKKARTVYFSRLFKDLSRPPEGMVLAILRDIFPTVRSYLNGGGILTQGTQSAERAEAERRVCHPDFFFRYFIFNVPADLFGEAELDAFIRAMNGNPKPTQSASLFKNKYEALRDTPMKRFDFLRRVNLSIEKFSATANQALVTAISELSDMLDEEEASFDELTAIQIVFGAANQLQETTGTQSVLKNVIKDATSDSFATQVLNECGSNRHRFLSDAKLVNKAELEQVFRERMGAKYKSNGKFSFFPNEVKPKIFPLGRWALCGSEGAAQVHEYLLHEFRSAHWKVGRFLTYFFPVPEDSPPIPPLNAIENYFPLKELRDLVDEYGDSCASTPDQVQAVGEFKWAYPPQPPDRRIVA